MGQTLNVVIRGQSNAMLFSGSGYYNELGKLDAAIERYLGYDADGLAAGAGRFDVNIIADIAPWRVTGNYTINDGTAFMNTTNATEPSWIAPRNGDWTQGWVNLEMEAGFLRDVSAKLPQGGPTAIVWYHSEFDSTDANLTTQKWLSAVQFDMNQVRALPGMSGTSYLFVDPIPYGPGNNTGHQAIARAMETLANDATANARIAARLDDSNMNRDNPSTYGGAHTSQVDADTLVDRLARSVAENFKSYALAGSPLANAGGNMDNLGPQVVKAETVTGQANQLLLTVAHDAATGLKTAISTAASAGVGWSLVSSTGQQVVGGTAASIQDATHVLVTFSGAVPTDGSAQLYYSYGYGRLAVGNTPGAGNAVYDSEGLPIWTSAYGVQVTQGSGGSGGGTTPPPPPPPPVDAAQNLVGGRGRDVLIGGGGNDTLTGGGGGDQLTGGAGQDTFRYASPSEGGDRITDFAPGVDHFEFSAKGFGGGLSAGALASSRFVVNASGTAATSPTGQFIYESSAGKLWWDADGTGRGRPDAIATLDGTPALQASDLVVIA